MPVVTLDHGLERYDWRDIGFLKIDAEGEESNILQGGQRFFAELSPLVQYEIKAGDDLHMELARVARDCGERQLAVNALCQLRDAIVEQNKVDPAEPFLAPAERFDSQPVGNSIGNWVLAAVLEEIERLGAYSSFFTGTAALPRLETLRALGLGSAEMDTRLRLLQKRFGLPAR